MEVQVSVTSGTPEANINGIAAQILSRPQIKRAIVMRAQDSCSANEAVGKRPSPMRAIRHAAR
jgi:hypothetical protein